MTPASAELTTISVSAPHSIGTQEIILLETLKSLLDVAMRSLSAGQALPLLDVSRQISVTAKNLTEVSLEMGRFGSTSEAQAKRRKLLDELGQQRAFCRAMLRRWRRSIALRQQLLGMACEPVPYTDALPCGQELR